jgi:hypothetical protein
MHPPELPDRLVVCVHGRCMPTFAAKATAIAGSARRRFDHGWTEADRLQDMPL